VAHSPCTYVLLLCFWLGACPQELLAGQREAERKPLPVPLLPAEEAWTVTLPSPPSAPGALDETRAYFPLQSGEVVALNRETGETEWSVPFESAATPVVGDGILYVAGAREVQAIQTSSGQLGWTASLDAETLGSPVLQEDLILLLVKPDQLRTLRASDGTEIWRRQIGAEASSPTLATDTTGIWLANGSRLRKFASSDGQLIWEQELGGVLGQPAVAGDRVFVGSTDNSLYALDAESGRLAWRSKAGGDVVGAVADERLLYVASLDNLLRALRPGSGNQIWKQNLSTRTTAPPSSFGRIVIVSGNNPTLSTFDATSGAPIASLVLAADLQGVPLVDPSPAPFRVTMVALTREGRAIGLRSTGMMFRELPLVPLQTLPGRPLTREPFTLPNSQSPTTNSQPPSPNSPTSK
jgi:eukaryotic-like serine/threonine-protein kinase